MVFHALKLLLDDFSPPSIEMLALFIETCGRYLYRMPETSAPMQNVLDQLRRKRTAHHLDEHLTLLLDNAYYQCAPPARPVAVHRERSVMEQFLEHVFEELLTRATLERILVVLRHLDWQDSEVRQLMLEHFTSPWRQRHDDIYLLAHLLRGLQKWHALFVVRVLDCLSEAIEADLLSLTYEGHQRRMARMQYLGDLFNYRLVPSDVILDQLWRLCVRRANRADPPDNFVRVRMVCALLQACGACFATGVLRKRLDAFLVAFQYYVQTKAAPPMDVVHLLRQTMERIRPRRAWETDRAVLQEKLTRIMPCFYSRDLLSLAAGRGAQDEAAESGSESGDSMLSADSDDDSQGPRYASLSDAPPSSDDEEGVDEEGVQDEDLDAEAEAELERELAMLMAESSARDRVQAGAALERTRALLTDATAPRPSVDLPARDAQHMTFALLTRKQTQSVQVPVAASISVRARQQQQEAEAERRQLKAYVLAYRDRESDRDAA